MSSDGRPRPSPLEEATRPPAEAQSEVAPPEERAQSLPSDFVQSTICRSPEDADDSSPLNAMASTAGDEPAVEPQLSDALPDALPDALDEKFEDDFSKHLKKTNKNSRMKMGAVGIGLGAGLGVLASPMLLPGLVIAGIAGGAGGYWSGKMKGLKRLQRHGVGGSGAAAASNTTAPQRPTLRRLRYLVQWGHWQLLEYEEAPAEWRAAVLSEVVRAFSPWVQAMFLVRARLAGAALEADAEAQEIFQHLAPLYQCLQRSVFSEATTQACDFVEGAFTKQVCDERHAELCRIVFPTVLETISIMDRLAPALQAKLAEIQEKPGSKPSSPSNAAPSSKWRSKIGSEEEVARPVAVQKSQGRQRLRKIVDSVRGVLERPDLVETLNKPPSPDSLERFQSMPLEGEETGELLEPALCTELTEEDENGHLAHDRVPLVVPPDGVEDEAQDKDFHSCSEDEEDMPSQSGSPTSVASSTSHNPGTNGSSDRASPAPQPASSSSSSSSSSPPTAKFKDRLADFPRGRQAHEWDRFNEASFDVRSATYLDDRVKKPSAPSLLDLVNVDFFRIPPDGPVNHPATARGFYPMEHRKRKDGRFLFIQNWVFAPFQALIVSALDPQAPWLIEDTPQARTWNRFLNGSLDYHRNAFKVIACVEEGPWLVKRAAPKKPVLVGRQLKMETRYEPGEYLEITVDVSKSKADAMAVGIVMKALSRLELVLAMLIEGKEEDELPETLLVCAAMKGIDTSRLRCPDESWDWE